MTLAVTTELLLIPNVTLFELEKTTVPLVAVCVPAAAARLFADAVIVEPFKPNETSLLFEKVKAEAITEVVPAEMLMLASGLTEAVMTEPFRPNETPLPFENVIALRLFEVVPAETLMLVSDVATDAVMVDALSPNEMPFELLNVNAEARLLVVPALRLILA